MISTILKSDTGADFPLTHLICYFDEVATKWNQDYSVWYLVVERPFPQVTFLVIAGRGPFPKVTFPVIVALKPLYSAPRSFITRIEAMVTAHTVPVEYCVENQHIHLNRGLSQMGQTQRKIPSIFTMIIQAVHSLSFNESHILEVHSRHSSSFNNQNNRYKVLNTQDLSAIINLRVCHAHRYSLHIRVGSRRV